jgi:plasmid stabilization system protein ParE
VKIHFTPEARDHAKTVATWWRENGIVPDLFERELAEAQESVLAMPTMGVVYRKVRGRIIHRLLMPKTQQHFYYSVDEDAGVILVHMIWGARRGRGPKL